MFYTDGWTSLPSGDGLNEFLHDGRTYQWPDSSEQLKAIYDYIAVNGVPLSPSQNIYYALEVGETLYHDPTGVEEDATTIVLGIPGTRD